MKTAKTQSKVRATAHNQGISPNNKKVEEGKMARKQPEVKPEVQIDMAAVKAVAEEMNEIMFPEQPTDIDSMADDVLLAQVKKDMLDIDPKDPFSAEARLTLAELGLEIDWAEDSPGSDGENNPKDPVDLAEMGLAELTAFAKAKKIKVPPPFLKDVNKLRPYIEGKLAAPAEKSATKEKATANVNEYGHRLGTMTAVIDESLKNGCTEEKAVAAIVKAFPEKTPEAAKGKFHANVKAYKEGVSFNDKSGVYKMSAAGK